MRTSKGFSSGSYSTSDKNKTTQDKDSNKSSNYDSSNNHDSGGFSLGDMLFGMSAMRNLGYRSSGRGTSFGSLFTMAVIFIIVVLVLRIYLKKRKY